MMGSWVSAATKRAREQRPQFAVDPTSFERHLANFPASAEEHAADLYWAFACFQRDANALRALEHSVFHPLQIALERQYGSGCVEDALQQVRQQMLGISGPPGLLEYAGRGPLASWIRVVATRAVLKAVGAQPQSREIDETDLVNDERIFDWALLRARHAPQIKEAFREALAALTQRERVLLKLHLLEGLSVDKLASIFHSPRSTVHRWVTGARERVTHETFERLRQTLKLSRSEARSLVRAVHSQLQVSVRRLLNGH